MVNAFTHACMWLIGEVPDAGEIAEAFRDFQTGRLQRPDDDVWAP